MSTRDVESKYCVLHLFGIILVHSVMLPTRYTLRLTICHLGCFNLFSNMGHGLFCHPDLLFFQNICMTFI